MTLTGKDLILMKATREVFPKTANSLSEKHIERILLRDASLISKKEKIEMVFLTDWTLLIKRVFGSEV